MSKEQNTPASQDSGVSKDQKVDSKGASKHAHKHGGKGKGKGGKTFDSRKRNAWHFYAIDEQMANDVASIPFNLIPGVKSQYYTPDSGVTVSSLLNKDYFPSVFKIGYVPGPGYSTDATSGINMAARQMYSYIRRANSGARNYEAPDLMMYLLAMEDIYTQYFECRRAYSVAQTFYTMNRNMPITLIHALGFNYDDLRNNLANYRYKLNIIKEKINSLAVPNKFTSFQRRVVISSQLFGDSSSLRGGIYAFVADGYRKFSPSLRETGGSLVFYPYDNALLPDGVMKLSDRLEILDRCITAVITDDDMNTMCGDIIKAFDGSGLYTVADVPDSLVCLPIYDEDILAQIENSRAYAFDSGDYQSPATISDAEINSGKFISHFDIFQKDNILYYGPSIRIPSTSEASQAWEDTPKKNKFLAGLTQYINSHKDKPMATDVLEWSRCMTAVGPTFSNTSAIGGHKRVFTGLETITHYVLYTLINDEVVNSGKLESVAVYNSGSASDLAGVVAGQEMIQFDWRPRHDKLVITTGTTASSTVSRASGVTMDLKVFTVMDNQTLTNMHNVANYSVYYAKLF